MRPSLPHIFLIPTYVCIPSSFFNKASSNAFTRFDKSGRWVCGIPSILPRLAAFQDVGIGRMKVMDRVSPGTY